MAIVTSLTVAPPAAPSDFSNLVDELTVAGLAITDPDLSGLPNQVAFDLGENIVRFTAAGGFTLGAAGPTGTVTAIEVFDVPAGTVLATITGIAIPVTTLLAAARDGDVAAINTLLYGGADTINGGAGHDDLAGGAGADVINGGGWDDLLAGEAGADKLDGGTGHDTLLGGIGNDRLYGRSGNDVLQGGAHNDRLEGNTGIDTLVGGSGADTFGYLAVTDSGVTALTRDRIRDFRSSEGDRIDLSFIDADGALGTANSFTFIDQNAFGLNTPGQVRWTTVTGGVVVEASTDNDVQAEMTIFLAGVTSLVQGDFIL